MGKGRKGNQLAYIFLRLLLLTTAGVFLWTGIAGIETIFIHEASFLQKLFSPKAHEAAGRLFSITFLILIIIPAWRKALSARRDLEFMQEEQNNFRHFLEISKDVILTIDTKGCFTYLNPRFESVTGYTADEMIGKQAMSLLKPQSEEIAAELFKKAFAGEETPQYELDFLTRDNRTVPVEINAVSIKDKTGGITGRFIIARDISLRRKVQKALQESEEKFRALAETTPTAIMMYKENIWTYANPAAERISGYSEDELKTMYFWDIVAPDFKEMVQNRGQDRQQGKDAASNYEFQIQHKDGTLIWVELVGASTLVNGEPAGIITVTDISKYKLSVEALKKSEEKYRTILANIEDGYFELDLKGNITLFNNKILEMFNFSPGEADNINYRDFTEKESQEKLFRTFHNAYKTGEAVKSMEIDVLPKNRPPLPLEFSISLIRDIENKPAGFRGIARDISERKQLQEQLNQARKIEAIGTLAGGIAHDFNNLLMAIQGNITMLRRANEDNEKIIKRVDIIQQCIGSGADLTRQLLGFARGGKYKTAPLDINKLVEKTLKMFGQTRKEITIQKHIDPCPLSVKADNSQIEQVLINMYVNAWQAMPNGGTLEVTTGSISLSEDFTTPHDAAPGDYVRTSIADSGIGMSPETIQRIFEPFFTTKERATSTGLGLASAYGIIRNHDGFITVKSFPGRGTTFNLYLPESIEPVIKESVKEENTILYGSGVILLVDDEKFVLKAGKEMLKALGYTVLIADNGNDALKLFADNFSSIDLVILDMIMPRMNGGEIFEKMKEIDPEIKVVLSSGYSQDGAAEAIMSRGCRGFLQKPFDIESLSHTVHKASHLSEVS